MPDESAYYSFPVGITSGSVERDRQLYVDFVAKYQGDPVFREWVDMDPAGALRAEGLKVPEGVKVKLLSSAEDALHFVLPTRSEE